MPYLLIILFLLNAEIAFGRDTNNSKHYKTLIQSLDSIRADSGISATALLIVSPDKVLVSETLGKLSHDSNVNFSEENYIRIGSISKLFTGLSALALENESAFKLDKPISTYLDTLPLQNKWSPKHQVTTANLLEHTAGLGDMTRKEFSFNDPVSIEKAFLVDPSSRDLRWPPGYHSVYSNSGAGIAAFVIEKVSQKPFELFTEESVFKKMGLRSATYQLSPEVKENLIAGFNTDGKTPIPYWHTLYRAFGGINIKVKEMSTVLKMLLNKGKVDGKVVFSEEIIHRLETPQTSLAAQSGLEYGYGLGLYHFNVEAFSFIGHGGDADGYLSYLAYSRDLGVGYFLLINAFNHQAQNQMRNKIESTLIEGARGKPLPTHYTLSKSRIDELVGKYQNTTSRFARSQSQSLVLHAENGLLYTVYNSRKRQLIPVNEYHFRRQGEPVATIAIVKSGSNTVLQGDIGNFLKTD